MPHKARKLENIIYARTLYSGGILAPNPKAGNILSLEKIKKYEFPQRNAFCYNKHLFFCKHSLKMQSSTTVQKWLLGQEHYMTDWKCMGLEKEGCVFTRWGGVIWEIFQGNTYYFWEVKIIWRILKDQDILHPSHKCHNRSVLPTLLHCLAAE